MADEHTITHSDTILVYQTDRNTDEHFFFLLILRPPRSTPFPTRRSSDLSLWTSDGGNSWQFANLSPLFSPQRIFFPTRSEEHTSELQSPMYLVCRLLLEKKKKL